MARLLVIGGGLSGLSAAWHARQAGATVRVLEFAGRAGGVIATYQENGYLAEAGPNSLLLSQPAHLELLHTLGLREEIVDAAPAARHRFLVRSGRPVPVPLGPLPFLASPLLSLRAKLRLLREPWVPPLPPGAPEESLADFARRRFGPEALAYLLEPAVAGIFSGNPEKLSARHAFPKLAEFESAHGSVLRGVLALRRERRRTGGFRPRSISFRHGLAALPAAIAAQLGDALILQAHVSRLVRETAGTWSVSWETPAGSTQESFDAVVLAVPAHRLARLHLPTALADLLHPLDHIEHPPLAAAVVGYPRAAVAHPLNGFGLLVPAVEPFDILGVLFNSTLFPGRAPEGHVTLTAFVGGARHPAHAARPDDHILDLVTRDLGALLGISGAPTFQRVTRWARAIPQYDLAHPHILAALAAAERDWPGLAFAANYRGGVSITQCLDTGRTAALRALQLPSVAAP